MGNGGSPTLARGAAASALALLLAGSPAAQPSPTFHDLGPEIAARIAGALAPRASLSLVVAGRDDPADGPTSTRAAVAGALAAQGFRVVAPAATIPAVLITCSQNLRDRACLVEIQAAGILTDAIVTRPRENAADRANGPAPPTLQLTRLLSQRVPILDAARAGENLVVLDTAAITTFTPTAGGWRPESTGALSLPAGSTGPASPAWPRDLRGHLRIDGDGVDAFLPGVVCRTKLAPVEMSCREQRDAWPIGLANNGIGASGNAFTTPEGLAFFGATPLAADADARWLVATTGGALVMLDAARTAVATVGAGDEVAPLVDGCTSSPYVVAGSTRAGTTLQLYRVQRRQLVAVSPPAQLPGTLTALWPREGAATATVVVHDRDAGRYDAFQLSIACR